MPLFFRVKNSFSAVMTVKLPFGSVLSSLKSLPPHPKFLPTPSTPLEEDLWCKVEDQIYYIPAVWIVPRKFWIKKGSKDSSKATFRTFGEVWVAPLCLSSMTNSKKFWSLQERIKKEINKMKRRDFRIKKKIEKKKKKKNTLFPKGVGWFGI